MREIKVLFIIKKKKTFPFKAENAYDDSDLGPFCSWRVDVNSPRYTLCENNGTGEIQQ